MPDIATVWIRRERLTAVLESRLLLYLQRVGNCIIPGSISRQEADRSARYIETINYRYSYNTWLFHRSTDLLFLRNHITPQRFAAMTSLMLWLEYWRLHEPDELSALQQPRFKVEEWNDLWKVVAAMPRLRRLRVSIIKGRRRNTRLWIADEGLLDPLWTVTQPGEFVVWLSWYSGSIERYVGAPFRQEAPNINS
ncbi:hypothetical protein M409DRAFT_51439 [Zasmidium cellare ATCC 36951]|uniref:DUF7730 domain-containing protein n=1 Tax=Zasmidium cellare ATCC 36951 TaxID=1080233 RepID=A0A6A6CUK4_ZASCE|nr:uncharacterized protein M409DRAFT_51439 [Zasmidium cellare ATCC 36951]KAF2170393.1 hypothetical protein M409DRAFT_51439 [Zasmidium cellare ATCC 36951]